MGPLLILTEKDLKSDPTIRHVHQPSVEFRKYLMYSHVILGWMHQRHHLRSFMVYTRPWLWLMCIGGSSSRSSNLAGHLTAPPSPPQKKNGTPHKINMEPEVPHPWKRFKIIFQTIIFQVLCLSSKVYLSKLHCLRIFGGCISCIFIPRSHGTQRSTALLVAGGPAKETQ